MNRNKHLLFWSSLGVLGLLVYAAVEENFLREWRQIQKTAQAESGPIDVRLRQIVAPKLGVTDRCVTCHVGMMPGESGITGGAVAAPHPPVWHDPSEFGCTVCHGGQGRATEKDDAHGDVHFWPEPMLPAQYAYAGCGTCHTHIRVPNEQQLARGQSLVERYDCLACHRVDGRGGTIRPGEAGGIEGPDLSGIGLAGYSADWYEQHLAAHRDAASGPWKTSFGPIDDQGRQALGAFLDSRVGAPRLVEAKALFHSMGCRGCHKIGGVGGDDGPDLTLAGQKDPGRLDFSHVPGKPTVANWHAEHLRDPAKIVPGSQMPDLHLTESQVDLLTFYLMSLRRGDAPEAFWPKDRIRAERFGEREFATDGATLYGTFCAACHGAKGEGRRYPASTPFPAVGNPDFLAAASDRFLTETIRRGRPGRRMPAWGDKEGGLRPQEIEQLVAHLRKLSPLPQAGEGSGVRAVDGVGQRNVPSPPAPLPSDGRGEKPSVSLGRNLFAQHCAGCHGPSGEGKDAPALNNKVFLEIAENGYLVETIGRGRRGTAMPGFRNPSPAYPALSEAEILSLVAFIRSWRDASP